MITWLSQHGSSIERFLKFCRGRDVSPAKMALAWIIACAAVSCPIVGASSTAQVTEAAASVEAGLDAEGYQELTGLFDTKVKDEGLRLFPGLKYNYPRLRRTLFLAVKRQEG